MTPVQELQLRNALNPMTPSTTTQRTQYDPAKMQALKAALATPRQTVSGWESFANTLSQTPQAQAFEGGFGEQIIDPWSAGLSSLAQGFGGAYSARKADAREAANQAREDAIKAAELDNEAAKKVITDQVKYGDTPQMQKAKEAEIERINTQKTIDSLSNDLEDIGTRFDSSFKNIDDMQKNSTRWGRLWTDEFWGLGVSDKEKLARDEFRAWKNSMKNVLVNANRQAGSGSMSDADAERYEQEIGKAQNPAEARHILRSFEKRINAPYTETQTINGFTIEEVK